MPSNTPVYIELPEGLTNLTVKFYGMDGADTPNPNDDGFDNVSGPDALVELTNLTGLYRTYIDEPLSGWHYVVVNDLTTDPVATGWVNLTDTINAHYVQFDVPDWDAADTFSVSASGAYYNVVYRSTTDTYGLYFEWPDASVVTARKSVNGAPYASVAGGVSQLRAEADGYVYTLAYAAEDRPSTGTVVYELTDGTTTRFLPLSMDTGGAGSSGAGDYAITVNYTDINGAVQGVVASIIGTSIGGTTGTGGSVTFNVDGDATYTLRTTPPSGYDSVPDQSVVVSNADVTVNISLTETSPGGSCEIPPL